MVSCTQSVDQSDCGVDDSLQWRYGGVWQPDGRTESIMANTALCIASYADAL